MTDLTADDARVLLARLGVEIADGLSPAELDGIENRYDMTLADDHRTMLGAGLPLGRGWPDWRDGNPDELAERLRRPIDGVLFDVEEGAFWPDGWGERPAAARAALRVARQELATAARLVPVYGHRYLPGVKGSVGHPVLSVVQTDVIVYARDLAGYLRGERDGGAEATVTAEFWRDLV